MYENVKTVSESSASSTVSAFLKGILIASILTFVIFALFSVILSYTPLPEDAIPYIVFITQGAGSILAGFIPAKRAGVKGLITGGISALLYMLILWLISSLLSDGFYVNSHVLTMFLVSLIFGALGGITGVNFKDSNTSKKKR